MKKILLLLLSLALLLSSCAGSRNFERDAKGQGYTDTRSERYYLALDPAFEPAELGDVRGQYTDKETGFTRTFHEIPLLDPDLFLADDSYNVYYAGEGELDPATWEIETVLICEEDAASVEIFRLEAGSDDESIAEILALWFEDEGNARLPFAAADHTRSIKLVSADYPGLYYGFSFLAYDSGEAYFYDAFTRHTVAVPEKLAALLRPAADEEEQG